MTAAATVRRSRLEIISRGRAEDGAAPPLLFVHGGWHGAWCWDQGFLERVAIQGFEVHAMSLRGHGESPGRAAFAPDAGAGLRRRH